MADQAAGLPASAGTAPDRRRQLAVLVATGVAGAALVAVASALTWWSADFVDPLTGPLTLTLNGAACVPELVPLALVGLAGLGAALATGGLPRRLVGLVVLVCGLTVAVRSVLTAAAGPSGPPGLKGSLTRPADPVGGAQLHLAGPTLAVLGGVLLSLAGALVVLGVGARRLGARYERTSPATASRARSPRDGAGAGGAGSGGAGAG